MTSPHVLIRQFAHIGARLVLAPAAPRFARPFDLDIRRDRHGEHFRLLTTPQTPDLRVLHLDRAGRHLLLYGGGDHERLLCGHDERHWFVASIADRVSTVVDAKRSLLPRDMRDLNLAPEVFARRHNAVFVRQGEWFFVPTTRDLSAYPILTNEPLFRDRRSKPHMLSEVVRFGGTAVVIHRGTEYTPEAWDRWTREPKNRPAGRVERVMKDPEVYARGTVRHADHATLVLKTWHRVYANHEMRSINVSFYD